VARLTIAGRIAVALVAAFVGFLLVAQVRGQERFTQRLEAESEGDLARILASLNAQTDSLREEIASLKLQLLTLQTSSQRDETAVRSAREQLAALEVLAGTVAVHGPGIVLRVEDRQSSLTYDTFVDIVQELRDAGAEAIAVNDHRIGVASAFAAREGRVLVDDAVLEAPYRVAAIGKPDTLEAGLAIPGGVLDTLSAARGVKSSITRQAEVVVPALDHAPSFEAARPVTSGS
jgi:uncharacterized protein YlxW (UPF0749 family)